MTAPHDHRVEDSQTVFEGRIISVRTDVVTMPGDTTSQRDYVVHPGAVGAVVLDQDRVLLVNQYRHPVRRRLDELPAGLLDKPGEPALQAAQRELAEEAGLAAASWVEGPRFYTAPGFCDELMHLYLATDLRETAAGGDTDEQLEPSWMTLADALAAIDDGRIADAKTMAGVGWLARRLPSSAPRHDSSG
jgi:8-oxo-dGDP phosphatase